MQRSEGALSLLIEYERARELSSYILNLLSSRVLPPLSCCHHIHRLRPHHLTGRLIVGEARPQDRLMLWQEEPAALSVTQK